MKQQEPPLRWFYAGSNLATAHQLARNILNSVLFYSRNYLYRHPPLPKRPSAHTNWTTTSTVATLAMNNLEQAAGLAKIVLAAMIIGIRETGRPYYMLCIRKCPSI